MATLLRSCVNLAPNLKLLTSISNLKCIHTAVFPLTFQSTPALFAEPLKKKKRIDPAILKMRDERRKRKIEKAIKKLEKATKPFKPIDELEVPPKLKKEISLRQRNPEPLSFEEIDYREKLQCLWSNYKYQQHKEDMDNFERLVATQEKALRALKEESEVLYQEAIKVDPGLIPFSVKGPVFTPVVKNYDTPDGEYIDVTKKWR